MSLETLQASLSSLDEAGTGGSGRTLGHEIPHGPNPLGTGNSPSFGQGTSSRDLTGNLGLRRLNRDYRRYRWGF